MGTARSRSLCAVEVAEDALVGGFRSGYLAYTGWKGECKRTAFLGSTRVPFQVGKLTRQLLSEVTVGSANSIVSFQVVRGISSSFSSFLGQLLEKRLCEELLCVSSILCHRTTLKSTELGKACLFYFAMRMSCFLKLHSEFSWMSSCQLLPYLGKEKCVP